MNRLKAILRGASTSLTVHAGTLIAVAGYLQGQGKMLDQWFGPDGASNVMMGLGLAVVLLRARTNQSLEAKGTK